MLAAIATLLNTNPVEARQYWHTDDSGGNHLGRFPGDKHSDHIEMAGKKLPLFSVMAWMAAGFPYQQEYGVAVLDDSQQYQRMRHAPFRLEPA